MMQSDNQNPLEQPKVRVEEKGRRPNESTGLNIDEHVKIFDPKTREVMLEKRA